MAAFEAEKKKTLARIFRWRPDMCGYATLRVRRTLLMTLSCMVVLIGILCIVGGRIVKKE